MEERSGRCNRARIVGHRVGRGFTVASLVSSADASAKTTSIRYSIELLRKVTGEAEDREEVKLSSGKGCV